MARRAALISEAIATTPTTTNTEGYPAYDRTLKEQIVQALTTNTLTGVFYADEKDVLKEVLSLLHVAVDKDPVFLGKAAVYARNVGYMRTIPILALVKLSGGGDAAKRAFAEAFPGVILTPNDCMDFFALLAGEGRGTGGRLIKRVAGEWLLKTANEYWAIKYGGTKAGQISYRDLFRITRPKYLPNGVIDYIVHGDKDQLTTSDLRQIRSYQLLKFTKQGVPGPNVDTAAVIREGRLPHEVVTQLISSKEEWTALGTQMPIFALLRNLATLQRHSVIEEPEVRAHIEKTFGSPERVLKSKIFPFRFLDAMKLLSGETPQRDYRGRYAPAARVPSWVLDSLRDAVEASVDNLPELPGKTAILLDISGSMSGRFLEIGSIFGVALMKATKGSGRFMGFDTNTYDYQVSLRDSTLTQAKNVRSGGGTDTALPIQRLTTEKDFRDTIIMITDEQQNTGSPVYEALREYRNKVNPKARAFIVDVAPYQGSMVPPTDRLTHYIYGWSDQVLRYIGLAVNGWDNQVAIVERGVAAQKENDSEND